MTSADEAQRRRIWIVVVDEDHNTIVLDSCNKTAIRHQKTPNRCGSNFGDAHWEIPLPLGIIPGSFATAPMTSVAQNLSSEQNYQQQKFRS